MLGKCLDYHSLRVSPASHGVTQPFLKLLIKELAHFSYALQKNFSLVGINENSGKKNYQHELKLYVLLQL
jgi:hypothetical protein